MKQYVITERENIVAIADTIREKTGSSEGIALGDLADSIRNGIAGGGGSANNKTKSTIQLTTNWYDGHIFFYLSSDTNLVTKLNLNEEDSVSINTYVGSYIVFIMANEGDAEASDSMFDYGCVYYNGVTCTIPSGIPQEEFRIKGHYVDTFIVSETSGYITLD